MLDQRRVATQPDEVREQLFTARYANLRVWALYLTHQESAADDLVHDAFVQWMLSRTRLEEIENIDGYLRTMLRNMHFSRMSRAAQRLQETTLSIADYDSGQLGWTAVEPPRRLQASEDLHQICAYACSRKESSKAGSVLILRFFHNYFPSEIASVLNSSRNCVDQWQRLARREAKSFMNRPGGLRFVNGEAPTQPAIRYLGSDSDVMVDLRQWIFSSCRGECLSREELNQVYARGNDETLTTAKLAHLVSCLNCLDAVNEILGLPRLAERYRNDAPERKEPPTDATGGGASGGGPTELRKKLAHRLRTTHEHKPQELRIAVNGLLVSAMKVGSELSELDLNLAPEDPIEFVEICSEQGIQLLFFSINSTGPRYEQWAWIELSEGRLLEAFYEDANGPRLHVVYKDPAADEAESFAAAPETNALSSPLTMISYPGVLGEPDVGARRGVRGWVNRLLDTLRSSINDTEHGNAGSMFSLSERRHSHWRFAFIVLASIAVAAAFLYFKISLSHELNAGILLERATVAEQSTQKIPDRISHRLINLEERRSTEGAIVARRRIEIWQHHANGNSARRLYDDSNQLIAGAWQKSDGSRTVFHHGSSKPRSDTALANPADLLLNLEDIWQLEPSAQSFAALISERAAVEVEERSTTYVLTSEKERTIGVSRLLKATLTMNKSDLHAIEQTLLVQRGNELHEYRFVEVGSEQLPLKAVAPAVFDIDPQLNGGAAEPGRPGDWAHRDLTSGRVPPSPSTSAPPAASAELEVDVAYLLNRAKADRNEQVTLTRSAGGSLRVEGILDTEERKQEFLRTLAPVSNNPAVKIEIRTVAEAMKRPVVLSPVTVQEETANAVAADE